MLINLAKNGQKDIQSKLTGFLLIGVSMERKRGHFEMKKWQRVLKVLLLCGMGKAVARRA